MATLGDLKTRIITETSRDDLSDDLAAQLLLHIQRACEYYADTEFWFNRLITSVTTTPASDTLAIPATIRRVERLRTTAYDTTLQPVQLTALDMDGDVSGSPDWFAVYDGQVKLSPVPDAAYTLELIGLRQIDAPADDGDSNEWTNEAQDLICAHTKMTLYRGQFRDPEGVQLALAETQDALKRLKRETARQMETPLRPTWRTHERFNIVNG